MNPEALDRAIRDKIAVASRIVIISHVQPDGDAVGSLLGLGAALIKTGKTVQLVLEDGVPEKYSSLKYADQVSRSVSDEYDLSIVVDASDPDRIGSVLINHSKPDIVIDHHKTNLRFAHLNLVEEDEVATAAVLANHMPAWGLTIDIDVAAGLLTGIIADTIGFRTSNMTSEALRISADLIDKGADLVALYRQALVSRPFEAMRYWGAGLNRLQRDE
ncbi:MAG: DHH family phosphoesterase, partial [Anaerolineaceae bacterium]|nr:DHH family phosphoesterase [Anaerolineaceae bacterium]